MEDQDLSSFKNLLNGLTSQVSSVSKFIQNLMKRASDGELQTSQGLDFLEVKHQLLLSYLINLTQVMLQKTQGKQIEGMGAIHRLVEIRTVLEKMRPIDQKIQYQVDKLVKTANTGQVSQNDPHRFKPNPDNFVSKIDGESNSEDSEDGEDEDKKKEGVRKYVPPKVAAMHFEETGEDKQQRLLEKAKKRALSSSIIQELREEYHEGPEEIVEQRSSRRKRAIEEARHKKEYEESHFVRIPVTKKDKKSRNQEMNRSGLEGLTRFDDISVLTHEGQDGEEGVKKRRKPSIKERKMKKRKLLKKRKKRF